MKRNLFTSLILILVLSGIVMGQQSNAYRDQMNTIFANVNSTPITTGLLADYGMELIYVPKYNGTLMDTNKVDMGALRAIYTSLYSMRFNSNFALSTPAEYNTAINNYLSANPTKVPIVGVHVNYQQFKTNATSLGLSMISNKLYCGNTAAPYEQKSVFAIALGNARLEGPAHQFIFPLSLFKSNTGKSISQI
jgi:hypothetical protein